MSEYISKQTAIRAFAEYEKRTTPSWSGAYKETLDEWIDELTETLSDIPTIDLVHCRECKYWQDNNGGYPHEECRWFKGETPDANDFCSYGERID